MIFTFIIFTDINVYSFEALNIIFTFFRFTNLFFTIYQDVTTCCFSVAQSLCNPVDCSMPSFPVHHELPEFAQTHVRWVGYAIQPSQPLLSPSPAFNLSQLQGFYQWVSSSHQMANYWIFSFSICPSSEYSKVNSFRIDCFDLVTVQGTLKSLFQSQNSSVLNLLYGVALTSLHNYWKHHSFEYTMDLCWQSNVSAF